MQFIKYVGLSHRRIITADDFRRAGVTDQQTMEWSYNNGFSVAADQLSEKAMRVAIDPDPSFVVVSGDEHAPRYLGQRMTPGQAESQRIDMSGVVGSDNPSAGLSTASSDTD